MSAHLAIFRLWLSLRVRSIGVHIPRLPLIHIHNLKNYPFISIHEKIARIAQAHGFEYLDFYESLKDTADQSSLWAMPGDPHPNTQGHRLMANQLYNYLAVFSQ